MNTMCMCYNLSIYMHSWTPLGGDTSAGLLEGEGVWLRSLRSVSSREAADLIIGLLFAAHKNPGEFIRIYADF